MERVGEGVLDISTKVAKSEVRCVNRVLVGC